MKTQEFITEQLRIQMNYRSDSRYLVENMQRFQIGQVCIYAYTPKNVYVHCTKTVMQ
jgi:hypothetical protein